MADRYKKWLHVPESYQLVVGDTFELFYRGIILATDPYIYNIDVRCPKGASFRRKFVYTPTEEDVGEYKLRIELSDDKGMVLDNAEVKLVVNPKAASPAEETYILCIGDSLTSGGLWPSECYRRLTGGEDTENNGPCGEGLTNIRFIGGREGKYGAWYEGYGGWRHDSYNNAHMASNYFKYIYADHGKTDVDRHSVYTDGTSEWKLEELEDGRIKLLATLYKGPLQASGVLRHVNGGENHGDIIYSRVENASGNPFWNVAEEKVDYKSYVQKLGVPRIDIAVVILGWNSWGQPEAHVKEQLRIFIDNLRRDFPECKIIMTGLQVTSSQDGLGTNYGCSWSFYEKLERVFVMEKWYRDVISEYQNIYYVNFSGQFDSEYNYPTIERPVNVRSKKTEIIHSNGVHPNPDGYRQIADLVYRQLNSMLIGRE